MMSFEAYFIKLTVIPDIDFVMQNWQNPTSQANVQKALGNIANNATQDMARYEIWQGAIKELRLVLPELIANPSFQKDGQRLYDTLTHNQI